MGFVCSHPWSCDGCTDPPLHRFQAVTAYPDLCALCCADRRDHLDFDALKAELRTLLADLDAPQ